MRKSNNNETEKNKDLENIKKDNLKKEKNVKEQIDKEHKNNYAKEKTTTKTIETKQENLSKAENSNITKNHKIVNNSISEISDEVNENLKQQSKMQKSTDNSKALAQEKDIDINNEKLEKIKNEIKKSKKESKDKVKKSGLRKKLVRNLSIAIIITIYFLFIDLGINSIPVTVYMLDLKTFAIFIAIISIVIFEKAYKKDENYLAVHGIEMIVVGIETLLLLQLYSAGNEYFNYILLSIIIGMIVYYLIKCLYFYIRYKVKGK